MSTETPRWGPGQRPRPRARFADAPSLLSDARLRERLIADERPRDASGHWVPKTVYFDWATEDAALDATFERAIEREFGHRNLHAIPGLTYRMTKRQQDDARRSRERVTTCLICARELPKGSRSDKDTCSAKCRQQKRRMTEAAIRELQGRRDSRDSRLSKAPGDRIAPATSHGSAVRIGVLMGPKRLSPLAVALLEAVENAWRIPMPSGYPDEVDWRQGQLRVLFGLLRDERALGRSSVATFTRRARSYIRSQARLSANSTRRES